MEIMTNRYEVIFDPKQDTALIRITDGKFINFIYQYKDVSINDLDENDELKLKFSYELQAAPESYTYENEDADKKEFEHVLGNILYDIIVNSDKVKEISGINNTK